MKEEMHPSGLTMKRWNWPFKTAQERDTVAKWFKKEQYREARAKKEEIHNLEQALL
jgi:hypothetical protein